MCIYTGFIMSLLTISVHEISGELRPVKTVSRDYYDDTTREVFGKQLEQLESVEDVEISSENSAETLIGASYWDEMNTEEVNDLAPRGMQIPTKKKLCILTPERQFCVEHLKQIIVSKNAVAKLEAQVNNLPKGRYRPGDVGDSQHSAESNREYQIPSSKKTLCIFSPPKEYCVVQMKDISSSDPQEVILPRHAVVDDVAETGVADDDKVGVSDEDDGNTHNIKGG
ncbi:uncharacterized protein LOC134801946 isoform X2 [Cydia splendana]|uniref:uncharacterized protein LOC134801946 isoform X2 n=1 Tax=Cydia splendana TaxID=1100963 RepID=UPI00300C08A9